MSFGRFEVHLSRGVRGVLLATKKDVGNGSLPLAVDLKHPPQDLIVVLHGSGVLCGRVTETSGTPAARMSLMVLMAELDVDRDGAQLPEPLSSQRSSEGLGRPWAQLKTDADGQFEARGLRPGSYVVRARLPVTKSGYPLLLTERPVPADAAQLDLCFDRPHIFMRLVRAGGESWPPSLVSLSTPGGGPAPTRWPTRPVPIVVPYEDSGQGLRASGSWLAGWTADPGEFGFDVKADRSYLVGAIGGGFDGTLQEVFVPRGSGRIEVTLTGRDEVPLGRISVSVTSEGTHAENDIPITSLGYAGEFGFDGSTTRITTRQFMDSGVAVTLEQLETGAVLLRASAGRLSPFSFEAPPGRYRVVADRTPLWNSNADEAIGDPGRAQAEITIVAGAEQQLQLELE